jgi:hypothetical protein
MQSKLIPVVFIAIGLLLVCTAVNAESLPPKYSEVDLSMRSDVALAPSDLQPAHEEHHWLKEGKPSLETLLQNDSFWSWDPWQDQKRPLDQTATQTRQVETMTRLAWQDWLPSF